MKPPPITEMAANACFCVLDFPVMDRLQTLLGKKAIVMLPRLIESFSTDAAKLLIQARHAAEAADIETLHRTVHTLKSNAGNFGAVQLAQLYREAEDLAKSGTLEGLPDLLTQFEAAYESTRTELN